MKTTGPTIDLAEMRAATLVMFDVAAFYLPLYDRDWRHYFEIRAPLNIVEGLVYRAERALQPRTPEDGPPRDVWPTCAAQIRAVLAGQSLLCPRAESLLDGVGRYFELARRLRAHPAPDPADVDRLAALRPCDLRLQHLMTARLIDVAIEPALFDALAPLEVRLELKANLAEYAEDVAADRINTLRLLARADAATARSKMTALCDRYAAAARDARHLAPPAVRARLDAFAERHESHYPSVPVPEPIEEPLRHPTGVPPR